MGSNPILSAIHIQTQAVSLGERFFYGLYAYFTRGELHGSFGSIALDAWEVCCIKQRLLSQFIEKGRCEHELRTEC